jgi:hypothetical protein
MIADVPLTERLTGGGEGESRWLKLRAIEEPAELVFFAEISSSFNNWTCW